MVELEEKYNIKEPSKRKLRVKVIGIGGNNLRWILKAIRNL